jgi:hypothetical protein
MAQDIILLLNGKEMLCLMNREDEEYIYYTALSSPFRRDKSDILEIRKTDITIFPVNKEELILAMDGFNKKSSELRFHKKLKGKRVKKRDVFSYQIRNFEPFSPYEDSISILMNEKVIYWQDTLNPDFFYTEEEMEAWVMGRRSARKHFRSIPSTLGGVASGLGGGMINLFYSPIPVLVYTVINGVIKPRVKHTGQEDAPFLNNELFIAGYQRQATKKKWMNSVLGALPGLAGGILINHFLIK